MKRVWVTLMLGVLMVAYGLGGAVTTAWAQQTKPIKIGVDISHRTNPFWVNLQNAAEQAGRDLGIEVRVMDHERRIDKQVEVVQGFIASKMDGLVVVPEERAVGPRILKMAQDAGIPIAIIDRWPEAAPSGNYISFMAADDVIAGYDIAMALIRAGCKRMVAVNGPRGASNHEDRVKGRNRALAENPDVKLVAEDYGPSVRAVAVERVETFLTAYPGPGFDCVWNANDDTAVGSWKVLSDRGLLGKVKVAGMDLLPEAIELIKKGTFEFSAGGHYLMGAFSVVVMHDFLRGIKPAEPIIKLKMLGVTKANVLKYEEQFIKNAAPINWRERSRLYNPQAKTYFDILLK
ncbi:MAG: substrate-binding domain-containing protein [candidate division NC10 bacterium]|nr:substrate-binding domain-containing protein [candidate division NC10 bacterium]